MLEGYDRFKQDVLALTTIDLNCYREAQMKRRIDSLIGKSGADSYASYAALLKKDGKVLERFINYLTINVSEFYRNPDQWEILDKRVFPGLIRQFGKNIKIWSAACSTGDEPYSLVMALSKFLPLNQIQIVATDIDRQVLEKAKIGLYSQKSIANVPDIMKKRYFKKNGDFYQVSDQIKRCVRFMEHNLLKDVYPSGFHMIVCRNVVIYFTDDAKREIYMKFHASLKERGVLFIGNTEFFTDYRELKFERTSAFFFTKA